jgi:transposase
VQRRWKLRKIRELLRDLPGDEAAVFQDEVDLNLNPDIGCMWMRRGEQAEVVTPGTNVKRYLSGSMSWRTGELVVTEGTRRNAELFVRHLDDLRRRFRYCRGIHVICDNARFHTVAGSRLVRAYLAEHGDRMVLHYLPAYSPQDNPIERVWWHLHEQITRYFQKLWTAATGQAAAFRSPSTNTAPSIRSCSLALPLSFRQRDSALSASLKAIARPAAREPGPLVR